MTAAEIKAITDKVNQDQIDRADGDLDQIQSRLKKQLSKVSIP